MCNKYKNWLVLMIPRSRGLNFRRRNCKILFYIMLCMQKNYIKIKLNSLEANVYYYSCLVFHLFYQFVFINFLYCLFCLLLLQEVLLFFSTDPVSATTDARSTVRRGLTAGKQKLTIEQIPRQIRLFKIDDE